MHNKLKRGDAVEIKWRDHNSTGGWKVDDEVRADLIPIRTVGMFCKSTKNTVVVMQSTDRSNDAPKSTDHIVIGKRDITSIRRLR